VAYHKVIPELRRCAHCTKEFLAAHASRIYCKSSCNTQAYERRKAVKKARTEASTTPAEAAQGLAAVPAPTPLLRQTLDWNLNNIALLGTASALGQLGVQLGTALFQLFTTRTKPTPVDVAQRPDPLSWLPAGLLTAAAPRVSLILPSLRRPLVFVELHYLGHVLYYQPRERLLLWRVVPGTLLALLSAEYVDGVAEQVPYQAPPTLLAPAAESAWGSSDESAWASPTQTSGNGYPIPQAPPITPGRRPLGQPKVVG
jgi:ribosomal protein S27AE